METNNLDKTPKHTQEPNKPTNKTNRGWMWLFNNIILPFGIALGVSYGIAYYYIEAKNDEISELKREIRDYEMEALTDMRIANTVNGYKKTMQAYDREHYLEWFAEWADKAVEELPASEERTAFLKDMELALKDNKVSDEEYEDIEAKYDALQQATEADAIIIKIKPITSKG